MVSVARIAIEHSPLHGFSKEEGARTVCLR
jgi:hypothetical protein